MRTPEEERRKQWKDQSAHALWACGTALTPFLAGRFLGDFGVVLGLMTSGVSDWYWTHRERNQFRDGAHVWWDPLLDNGVYWTFRVLVTVSAYFVFL